VRTGPRGKRQAISGEALVRGKDGILRLHEVLACGHYVEGVYNRQGESCSAQEMPVKSRICRQCLDRAPPEPPGEIVDPA